MRRPGAFLAALPVLATLAALPRPASAQPVVESVRLVADVDPVDRSAVVRLAVDLAGLRPEDVPVAVRALAFRGTSFERVEAGGRPLSLDAATPSAPVGRVDVQPDPDGRATLELRYRVAGAVAVDGVAARVRVPVLAPPFPPADGRPGVFEATVRAPATWRVAEGFPSTVRAGETAGEWAVDLAVVPAVVSLRARTDGTWRPGLAGLLDGVALVCLVGFFVAAGRHLARSE